MFQGKTFCLALVSPRKSKRCVSALRARGARRVFSVTPQTSFLVCEADRLRLEHSLSSHVRQAFEIGVPVVSTKFVDDCVQAGHAIDMQVR